MLPGFTSIRSKILIIVLSAALPAVTVISISAYIIVQKERQYAIEVQYERQWDVTKQKIEEFWEATRADILFISQAPPVSGIIRCRANNGIDPIDGSSEEQWIIRLQSIFITSMEIKQHYDQIRYIDKTGMEVVRINNINGEPVIISGKELQNKKQRYYFSDTAHLKKGECFYSPIDLNKEHGMIEVPYKPMLRVATPVYTKENTFEGIVIINVLMSDILHEEWGNQRMESDNKIFFIVNEKGEYLHHCKNPRKEWGSEHNLNTGENMILDYPDHAPQILEGGITIINDLGHKHIIFSKRYQFWSDKEQSLVLAEAAPYKNIIGYLYFLGWYFFAAVLVVLAAALIIAYFGGLRLVRPIKELSDIVSRFNDGEKTARVENPGKDEVGQVALIFNKIAENSIQYNTKLKETVKERTEELDNSRRAALSMMQDAEIQRKRIEETLLQLEKSNEELKKLYMAVEQSPVSVVITDKEGTIEYVNPWFCKCTGYSPQEVIGENPRILNSGYHSREFFTEVWNTILSGNQWTGDFLNKTKDGKKFWETVSIAPLFNDERTITHFVAVKQDVTERKKMEEELKKAKEKAEAATKAKSNFLARMSHEIRTPMNAIIGMSYLALQTELNKKQKDYVTKIEISAQNLLGIINDILDFSKIEAGKIELEQVPFNFLKIRDNILNILLIKAEEKGLSLVFDIKDSVPVMLKGDPLRISQVLLNLMNNAIKFTKEGKISTLIRVLEEEEESITLEISVKDTGIGIKKSEIKKLFQSFSQADTSTTRFYGGTGLGLAITKRLVELMGGTIHVESDYKKGSSFIFTLQLKKLSEEEKTIEENNSISGGTEVDTKKLKQLFKSLHILVAEDKEINQQFLLELLESYNIKVTMVNNGKEALEQVNDTYDLILMDLQMPIMDGYESALQIRKNFSSEELPIIALTADAIVGVKEKCLNIGMNDFIPKPIEPENLILTLLRWTKTAEDIQIQSIIPGETTYPAIQVDHISTAKGIKRLNGNLEVYIKMLFRFRKNNLDTTGKIEHAFADKKLKELEGMVHAIKGISGNIGADELFEISTELNEAVKTENLENIPGLITSFKKELTLVLNSIESFEQQYKKEKNNENGDKGNYDFNRELEEMRETIDQLNESFKENSMNATGQLSTVKKQTGSPEFEELTEKLSEYLEEYDFDRCSTVLDTFINQYY